VVLTDRDAGYAAGREIELVRKILVLMIALALSFGAGILIVYSGKIDVTKVRNFLQYNPLFTSHVEVLQTGTIETNQLTLNVESFAVPALIAGFDSGGGAIIERDGGVAILTRMGKFYSFKDGQISQLAPLLANNNDSYEAFARAGGYYPGPGSNLGYAGLGMRDHDLLQMQDGTLLASQTYWKTESNCAVVRVMRLENTEWKQVAETSPCIGLSDKKGKPFAGHQAGGRMIELQPGKVLLTTGDFKHDGSSREAIVNGTDVDYGKTLLVDVATGAIQVYSSGHRSPQGLMKDHFGRVWSTVHGPVGGDELNLIQEHADYGWPRVTLGMDCEECDWQLNGRHDGFQQPVFSWVPSIGTSNLIEVIGFARSWDGDFLVASLKGESLRRLRIHDGRVQFDEAILIGDRIRDMIQLENHKIVLWTDSGHLIFLSARTDPAASDVIAARYSPELRTIVAECRACHSLDPGKVPIEKIGLWGVVGRSRAATAYPNYSEALKQVGGSWSESSLDEFLKSPQEVIKGTTMTYAGVPDANLRAELVMFLAELK
jgi:cytochrome c2